MTNTYSAWLLQSYTSTCNCPKERHTFILPYVHASIIYIYTYIHAYIHKYIQTCIHTYMHTYFIHTCMNIYIQITCIKWNVFSELYRIITSRLIKMYHLKHTSIPINTKHFYTNFSKEVRICQSVHKYYNYIMLIVCCAEKVRNKKLCL